MEDQFKTVQMKVSSLLPNYINPRKITAVEKRKLEETLGKWGMIGIPVINMDGKLLSGHQRCESYIRLGHGDMLIDVRKAVRALTEAEEKEVMLIENKHNGEFDLQLIKDEFADFIDSYDFTKEIEALEAEMDRMQNDPTMDAPEMPIVPKLSEKYTAFVVVCRNEIDENHVAEKFGLERGKCYKSSSMGMMYVVDAGKILNTVSARP